MLDMSNFIIEITDPQISILKIETSFIDNSNNLEIERSESFNIELINTEKLLVSDLPDNIPMSKIVGNLSVLRIDGLDDYLDDYEFDCGSP
jgi:hypothetical protein